MNAGTKLDVELLGGPLDGHLTEVVMKEPGFDMWLFQANGEVTCYVLSGTTTDEGRRWVLRFFGVVGRRGVPSEK